MASDCMKLGLIFGQNNKEAACTSLIVAKGVTALLERDKSSGKQKGGDFPHPHNFPYICRKKLSFKHSYRIPKEAIPWWGILHLEQ